MPITAISILPLSYDKTKDLTNCPFEFEEDTVVFQVSYGEWAWYFYAYAKALTLVNVIIQLKAIGLGWREQF